MATKKNAKTTSFSKKSATPKKQTKNSSLHKKKVTISVDSPNEYEKELKKTGKPAFFHYESHPFVVGSLTILVILFLTAAVLAYFSFTTTVDAIVADMNNTEDVVEAEYDDVIEDISVPVELTDSSAETTLCSAPSYIITCDSEYPSNPCNLLYDNNESSQWLAAYSCNDRSRPCAVSNSVSITSEDTFDSVTILNRIERDYYINRMIVKYNNISETYILGQKFSQENFTFELVNKTDSLRIDIVEIVGSGNRYLSGLAEVSVASSCN